MEVQDMSVHCNAAAVPLTMICNTTILPEWSCLYQECR
ncbi:Monocopper oxidase-like protein SKU5 [Zea mays]|uniref:Monocopper oxidase-like protein SKU5 n=1 Tax=Zea mays TaxID=4577 RepID=A0A1D6FCC6_MAIZE|nr:Monocopper oxidase-like protein SKU5 [Zea mays]